MSIDPINLVALTIIRLKLADHKQDMFVHKHTQFSYDHIDQGSVYSLSTSITRGALQLSMSARSRRLVKGSPVLFILVIITLVLLSLEMEVETQEQNCTTFHSKDWFVTVS